jgi:hypothetical protein
MKLFEIRAEENRAVEQQRSRAVVFNKEKLIP